MAPVMPLADREMAAIVEVEREFQRRATTAKPWTPTEYVDRIQAVHVRYAQIRQARLDKARAARMRRAA